MIGLINGTVRKLGEGTDYHGVLYDDASVAQLLNKDSELVESKTEVIKQVRKQQAQAVFSMNRKLLFKKYL